MTYKAKCKGDGSCIDRIENQADSIRAYQDEINRLRTIVDKKNKAIDRAAKQIQEMQIKSKAFDEIDGYLTETYNKYHDMKNTTLRNRLISSHISKNVTLLFQRIGDKYGYKE